jgi:hypothetical protein
MACVRRMHIEIERPFIAKSLLDRHEPMPGLRGS